MAFSTSRKAQITLLLLLGILLLGGFLAGQLRNTPGGATNPDGSYRLVKSVGIPGLVSQACYDPLSGMGQGSVFGIGIIPA